jgi:hypothetical protein
MGGAERPWGRSGLPKKKNTFKMEKLIVSGQREAAESINRVVRDKRTSDNIGKSIRCRRRELGICQLLQSRTEIPTPEMRD